jgi:hypothetical protein
MKALRPLYMRGRRDGFCLCLEGRAANHPGAIRTFLPLGMRDDADANRAHGRYAGESAGQAAILKGAPRGRAGALSSVIAWGLLRGFFAAFIVFAPMIAGTLISGAVLAAPPVPASRIEADCRLWQAAIRPGQRVTAAMREGARVVEAGKAVIADYRSGRRTIWLRKDGKIKYAACG